MFFGVVVYAQLEVLVNYVTGDYGDVFLGLLCGLLSDIFVVVRVDLL